MKRSYRPTELFTSKNCKNQPMIDKQLTHQISISKSAYSLSHWIVIVIELKAATLEIYNFN